MDYSMLGSPVLHYYPGFATIMSIDLVMLSNHVILCQPFSFCLQPFPDQDLSKQLPGGQSIGASTSVLPMNIQDWFPLGLTGLISLQSKGFSRILQHHNSKALTLQRLTFFKDFLGGSDGKAYAYNAGDLGSIPG